MSTSQRHRLACAVTMLLVVGAADVSQAHPGHGAHRFSEGFLHPILGWDHLLATIGTGLLAARLGGRARWSAPATFIGFMLAGGVAAMAGMVWPANETGILLSVIVLGGLTSASKIVPASVALALIAMFAALHGNAHVTEMSSGLALAECFAGFTLSTILLLIASTIAGVVLLRKGSALRWTGAAIAASPMLLSFVAS